MKKICLVFALLFTTQVFAQSAPTPEPPQPVDPIIPQAAPAQQTAIEVDSDEIPTTLRVDPVSFNTRLGVGTSLSPSGLWISTDVEVQVDKFLAVGPKLQYGNNSSTDFIYTSIGPRFVIPYEYLEFGVQGGVGLAYRNAAGFIFNNFLYQASLNAEIYLFKNFSTGVAYNANFTSSQADQFISAFVFSITGHF